MWNSTKSVIDDCRAGADCLIYEQRAAKERPDNLIERADNILLNAVQERVSGDDWRKGLIHRITCDKRDQ